MCSNCEQAEAELTRFKLEANQVHPGLASLSDPRRAQQPFTPDEIAYLQQPHPGDRLRARMAWLEGVVRMFREHIEEGEYMFRGGDDPICGLCGVHSGHALDCDIYDWRKALAEEPRA